MSTFVGKTVCHFVVESLFLLVVGETLIDMHRVCWTILIDSLQICYQLARVNLLLWKLSICGKNLLNYTLVLQKIDSENEEKKSFEVKIQMRKTLESQ